MRTIFTLLLLGSLNIFGAEDFKSSLIVYEHDQSLDKNYEGVKESLQTSIKNPKLSIKVDNKKKGKIIANFNAGCAAGLFGANIDVFYQFTANFKPKKTRLILETEKLSFSGTPVEFNKDNNNLEKYKSCREEILKSIKQYSLKPKHDDNW